VAETSRVITAFPDLLPLRGSGFLHPLFFTHFLVPSGAYERFMLGNTTIKYAATEAGEVSMR